MPRSMWLRMILFVMAAVVADRILGLALAAGFQRIEVGETGGMVNAALRSEADVVVVGSSRAWRHYDTDVLARAFGRSVYNAGCDGQGPPYVRGLLDLMMRRRAPRVVIVEADDRFLARFAGSYDHVTVLAPFLDDSPVVRDLIYRRGPLERLKYLSSSFRYNSRILPILANLGVKPTTQAGFAPLERTMAPAATPVGDGSPRAPSDAVRVDAEYVELLRATLRSARTAGARVLLAASPRWDVPGGQAAGGSSDTTAVRRLAVEEGVPYVVISASNTPALRDPSLFADAAHLNRLGARVFTEALIEQFDREGLVATALPPAATRGHSGG